ncbi:MAG: hypothetical protein HZC41_00820 [Chloroflexi bacterium]|nr:hypothetical protein [Chloroflexota bacterium]
MDVSLDEVCQQLNAQNCLILIRLCIYDAITNAESMLNIFEMDYPSDEMPRKAIEAAWSVGKAIDQYLAGQAQWQEVESRIEAVWEAGEAVSEETMYIVKKRSALFAVDSVCHAAHTAGEAAGTAAETVKNAACAAASTMLSRRLVDTDEQLSHADERKTLDDVYNTKREEFHRIAAELLMKQHSNIS